MMSRSGHGHGRLPLVAQETVLPDEKLVTEALPGAGKALEDDSVLYLVYRASGDTFEKISVEDTSLPATS